MKIGNLAGSMTTVVLAASLSYAANICDKLKVEGLGKTANKYPNVGATGKCQNGVYALKAYGHDFYWGWDRGGFAYLEIDGEGDFSFSVKLKDVETNDQAEKVGINVREGLVGNERSIQLRWDGFFSGNWENSQISWFYRFKPGIATSEFCTVADRSNCFMEGGTGVKPGNGATVKISRVAMAYQLFVNGARVAADATLALDGSKVYVGLIGAFGGADFTTYFNREVTFENVDCTGAPCTGGVTDARLVNGSSAARWNATLTQGRLLVGAPSQDLAGNVASIALFNATGNRIANAEPRHIPEGMTLDLKRQDPGVYVAVVRMRDGRSERLRLCIL